MYGRVVTLVPGIGVTWKLIPPSSDAAKAPASPDAPVAYTRCVSDSAASTVRAAKPSGNVDLRAQCAPLSSVDQSSDDVAAGDANVTA